MILATLHDARRYSQIHPLFSAALDFLDSLPGGKIQPGRHEIDGDQLFAIAWEGIGNGQSDAVLECHRKYVDIQFVASGTDVIGWRSLDDCDRIKQEYDASTDLAFYFDQPSTWCRVPAGSLAIFFPEDVHAPLATTQRLKKVVVKIRLG